MSRRIALLLVLSACAPKVQVAHPTLSTVPLQASRVAVVAGTRECRAVADALVTELNHMGGITVDPKAEVRLEVIECGQPQQPIVVDVEIHPDGDRRRASVEGRAHALVAVKGNGRIEGHVIGATRTEALGNWNDHQLFRLSRTVSDDLTLAVAHDLAEQIRPLPELVERRVYARAPEGTAQALFNSAVEAERDGRVHDARRLAQAAHDQRPTQRTTTYIADLDRLIARLPPEPVAMPDPLTTP